MQSIKEITALETFSVRQPVLRPGKSMETCHFDCDNLASTRHFGLFLYEKLAGIASLFQEKTNLHSFICAYCGYGTCIVRMRQKQ